MIIGMGVDIIEQNRFISFLGNERKLAKILSVTERICLSGYTSEVRQLEFIASRFAAKEALYKAGLRFIFSKVSILPQKDQAPLIVGLKEEKVHLSISHNQTMSMATAIWEQ